MGNFQHNLNKDPPLPGNMSFWIASDCDPPFHWQRVLAQTV